MKALKGPRTDLSGQRFGRLVVLKWLGIGHDKRGHWLCRCDCGNDKETTHWLLTGGGVRSCGCLQLDLATKHGMSSSRIYKVWQIMIDRCHNESSRSFKHYGARGIRVCDSWRSSFENFYRDMGPRPDGRSLDRIDNDGNYEPGNCRWADKYQQANNTSRNLFVTIDGETLTVTQWARRIGIHEQTMWRRVKAGVPEKYLLLKRVPQGQLARRVGR